MTTQPPKKQAKSGNGTEFRYCKPKYAIMGLIDFRGMFAGGWRPMHFPQSSGVDFGDWFADGHRRACGFCFRHNCRAQRVGSEAQD